MGIGAENNVFLNEFEKQLEETLAENIDRHSKVAWLKRKKAQNLGYDLKKSLTSEQRSHIAPTDSEITQSPPRKIDLTDKNIVLAIRNTLKETEEAMASALPSNTVFGLTKKNVMAVVHRGNIEGYLHTENGRTHCVTPVESRVPIYPGENSESNSMGMTVVEIGDDNPNNWKKGKNFTFAFFGNDNLFHIIPKKTLVKTINKSLRKKVPCSTICEDIVKSALRKNPKLDYSINILAWL